MQTSDQIKDIATALAKAQAAMHGATKDGKNPAFKSSYATLSSVIEAARGPLTDNGIAFIQSPGEMVEGGITVTTTLMHTSGQWMRSTITMPVRDRNNPQAVGSACTYACRYSLMAMLGLPPVDDDGEAASKGNGKPDQPRTQVTSGRREAPPEPTDAERKTAQVMVDSIRMAESEADLTDWLADNKAVLEALPEALRDQVRQAYRRTLATLRQPQQEQAA